MAADFPFTRLTPRARASVARSTADLSGLAENEVVFVQRTGPRILAIPSDDPIPLGSGTLHDLRRGKLAQELAGGRRIVGLRMMACPDIEVEKNGSYTLKKRDVAYKDMNPITVNTLDVWTGQVGELRQDVDIGNLTFYSLDEFQLPSYHSWKDHDAANAVKEDTKRYVDPSFFNDAGATGRFIDLVEEERAAAAAEKIANDPEEKLRTKPGITPTDEAWDEIETFFTWILEDERKKKTPQIYKLIREEFDEAQQLLIIPTALTSLRSQIQEENTVRYQEALKTTFASRVDNLATKFAMLCFGLPIAPITLVNIKFAGGKDDMPGKVAGDALEEQTQGIRTILWSEKSLEFLDVYHSRGYGYPMIRSKKKPHNAIDTKSTDIPRSDETAMGQADFPSRPRQLGCGRSIAKSYQASSLYLRGGGGDFALNPRQQRAKKIQRVNVYTEMGRFEIDRTYEAFHMLISRLFRTSLSRFDFGIDILQDAPPGLKDFPEVVQSFTWSDAKREAFDQNQFRSHIEKEELQGKYKLRVRQGGQPREPYEPDTNEPHLVELFLENIGVAYWRLPVNGSEAVGTNQYQDTFRNAIECLLPEHRQFVVKWELESRAKARKQGQLVLAAEAPSKELWDMTLIQLKAKSNSGRVRITLSVVLKKELVSAKETRLRKDSNESKGELMIIVPGSAKITKSPLLGGHDHEEFLERIRTTVHARTSPRTPAIRLWSGPQNYTSEVQVSRYVIFPPTNQGGDSGLLVSAGIFLTADAVVARPEFNNFRVIDVRDENSSASWDPQKVEQVEPSSKRFVDAHHHVDYYSLNSFQKALRKLWPDYLTNEYVGILQSRSHDTFVVGPEMTEQQWRLQVFDWLDDENVKIQRNLGTALLYKKPRLKGPLGVTYSSGVMPTEAEKGVPTPRSIPAQTKKPVGVTPNAGTSRAVWNAWVKKQDQAHDERVAAFTADPSIFRRGRAAAADISIFGQPFEQCISVGALFPTIFTQIKTPAQANELQRDNRRLENIVLDRIQSCQMCSLTFPFGTVGEESKREHLQEHITALKEIEEVRLNNLQQGPGNKLLGIYCGVCGMTEDEFRKANPGIAHSPTCIETMTSRGIDGPQYCHHCGLNLHDEGLIGDDAKAHMANCRNQSRGSTAQRQVAIYQRLLKRLTGQRTLPPGELICHFQHCDGIFETTTSDSEIASHFLHHLDAEHAREKVRCQFPGCIMDVGGLKQSAVSRHLASHFPSQNEPIISWHPSDPTSISVEPAPRSSPSESPDDSGGRSASAIPAEGVDPNEDQKNIPDRLKKANPGKNFYCPVCYKLLGKQASPCNWHRQNCQVFGHEDWLILTAEQMKALKAKSSKSPAKPPVPKKRPTPHALGDPNDEPKSKKPKKAKGEK